MKVSICVTTYNKPEHLKRSLASIAKQLPLPFDYEWIVVDDTGNSESICRRYAEIDYIAIYRPQRHRNPAFARNVAWKRASGDIVVTQSDDIEHRADTLIRLVSELQEDTFALATVHNVDLQSGVRIKRSGWTSMFSGPDLPGKDLPAIFLGAVWRKHLCLIGGCEESFDWAGPDDVLVTCHLMNNGIKKIYSTANANHLDHKALRPRFTNRQKIEGGKLVAKAIEENQKHCSTGPWQYVEGVPVEKL